MANEVEAKLTAPASFDAAAALGGRAPTFDETVTLHATYWDTADLRLLAWGHTLRHRTSSDGHEDGWTAKVAGAGSSDAPADKEALARRTEVDADGGPDAPPEQLVQLLRPFVGSAVLHPVALLETQRRRAELVGRRGAVELAVDVVTPSIGGVRVPSFDEIEVELLHGDEREVRHVVDQLRDHGASPSGQQPKVARALSSVRELPPHPLTVRPLDRRSTARDLVRAAVAHGVDALVVNAAAALVGDDPDHIHDARVATRRLRSDLQTLGDVLDVPHAQHLRDELHWLGALFGGVRDLDVLADAVDREAEALSLDSESRKAVLDRLAGHHDEQLALLRTGLVGDRYAALVAALVAFVQQPAVRHDIDADDRARQPARRAAHAAVRRFRTLARRLGDEATDAELHELRRRAKRARYAHELVAPVLDRNECRRVARRMAKVQTALGEVQDAVVAAQWLHHAAGTVTAPEHAFALGQLAARFEQRRVDNRRASSKILVTATRRL